MLKKERLFDADKGKNATAGSAGNEVTQAGKSVRWSGGDRLDLDLIPHSRRRDVIEPLIKIRVVRRDSELDLLN